MSPGPRVESVGCVTGIRPDKVLEETTILNVRHGRERSWMGKKLFETIKEEAVSSLCKKTVQNVVQQLGG